MNSQMPAVGTAHKIAEMFIGSLLFSTANEARSVLRFVQDSDVDEPAATVLATVRALALRGTPPSSELVLDELKRLGKLTKSTGLWLASATTSGACSSAAHHYGAALVAESFRARVESFGNALTSVSDTASEAEIGVLVERTVSTIRGVAARLAELRGEG